MAYIKFKNPYAYDSSLSLTQCSEKQGTYFAEQKTCGYFTQRYGAILHEADNYRWTCKEFFNDSRIGLGDDNIFPGDGVSSITVFLQPSEQPEGDGVMLYDDTEYRKKELDPYGPLTGDIDRLGSWSDKARSIKIDGNYMTLLFRNENYKGECEVLMDDDPNLENNRVNCEGALICWDKGLSSLKIIPIKK